MEWKTFLLLIIIFSVITCMKNPDTDKKNETSSKPRDTIRVQIKDSPKDSNSFTIEIDEPQPKTKSFLEHPLFLLLIGAGISSILIPWITRRWQDRKKQLQLKTEIVQEIIEALMTVVVKTIDLQKLSTNKTLSRTKLNEIQEKLAEVREEWTIKTCIIGSKLHAYFPAPVDNEKEAEYRITKQSMEQLKSAGVPEEIKKVLDDKKYLRSRSEEDFIKTLEDDLKEKNITKYPKRDILDNAKMLIHDKWSVFSDEVTDLVEKSKEMKQKREDIFYKKFLLIKAVLDNRITGFDSLLRRKIAQILR